MYKWCKLPRGQKNVANYCIEMNDQNRILSHDFFFNETKKKCEIETP